MYRLPILPSPIPVLKNFLRRHIFGEDGVINKSLLDVINDTGLLCLFCIPKGTFFVLPKFPQKEGETG